MNTPIADFLKNYAASDISRFHMPGHKGQNFLGCESLDITEVKGADALYEASGIIAESEKNASALFGSARTVYSTEGSSQCIRAMLYLTATARKTDGRPVVVAARNVHKAFVYAAALLDIEVVWLFSENRRSLCSCPVSPEILEKTLSDLDAPPAAVYITSPDYLGNMADIAALAEICHRYKTVLAVDNAHGAYLRFLSPSQHPLDLGADICCDSAHKTLPVLTGGAYLHIGKNAPRSFAENAKTAMALFGSTSPSYLTLASLDAANGLLAGGYASKIQNAAEKTTALRAKLNARGWHTENSDPLRITVTAPDGESGDSLAEKLRRGGVECEFSDPDFLVLMVTPENSDADFEKAAAALGENRAQKRTPDIIMASKPRRAVSIRTAVLSPHKTVPVSEAVGKICGSPTVSCPPAVPVVVSGEYIDEEICRIFTFFGIETVDIID